MSNCNLSSDEQNNIRTAYNEICSRYRAIDDFRAKLLGFLPLASGAGIFLLLSGALAQDKIPALPRQFLLPIGVFGVIVTLGLYFYELRGIQYCTHLIAAGRTLEKKLEIPGAFSTRPSRHVAGFISEITAAHLIYAAVLAAWTFVATVFAFPAAKPEAPAILKASLLAIAVVVVVLGFVSQFNLRPPQQPETIAHVVNRMLELVRLSPITSTVSDEVEEFQQRMLKLSQKNLAPSSSDWETLHNIMSKVGP